MGPMFTAIEMGRKLMGEGLPKLCSPRLGKDANWSAPNYDPMPMLGKPDSTVAFALHQEPPPACGLLTDSHRLHVQPIPAA